MESLLQKAQINEKELKTTIIQISANEMIKLSESCYYPKPQRYYHQLLYLTGLIDKDIKQYIAEFFKGAEAAVGFIPRDPHRNLLLCIMYYFLKKRDIQTYLSTLLWYGLNEYSHIMHHVIPYCDANTFKYTLEHLSKTHLFVREDSISGALYFITSQMQNLYTNSVLRDDSNEIALFMRAYRTRIRQSTRSFQNLYYKFKKEGIKYRTPYTGEEGEEYENLERRTQVVDNITRNIAVYKQIDEKALMDAKIITKIRESLARLIIQELSNITYQDNIKMVIDLFVRDIGSVSVLCGKDFFKYTRSLMAIKRTTKQIYFKQQVNELLVKILRATKSYPNYIKYTPQSQSLVNSFLALYIAMFIRNKMC